MRKVLLILMILLMIGCGKNDEINDIEKNTPISEEINEKEKKEEEKYLDTNPIKVGLYNNQKLVTSYKNSFKDGKDIAVFNILYTNIETLESNNLKNNWYHYYNQYSDISSYKTGFYISFDTKEKTYESLILDPSAQYNLDPYLYPYLYDGVHATGRYTHLKMQDLNKDTIYSTIKIYLHQKTKEIISPIKLTVFTYKDDNDFIDGHYRGNSSYTVLIENK